MKNENIPADIKSKSIKELRDEIDSILNNLERKDANLEGSLEEYKKLIQLNKYIDQLFKAKVKEIATTTKKIKKNDKK
tara:strand:+ start:89 stop:322 length:234 start_codon:yes stop_codon:yes gene_type:complete